MVMYFKPKQNFCTVTNCCVFCNMSKSYYKHISKTVLYNVSSSFYHRAYSNYSLL